MDLFVVRMMHSVFFQKVFQSGRVTADSLSFQLRRLTQARYHSSDIRVPIGPLRRICLRIRNNAQADSQLIDSNSLFLFRRKVHKPRVDLLRRRRYLLSIRLEEP